jgi:hypothetical protein
MVAARRLSQKSESLTYGQPFLLLLQIGICLLPQMGMCSMLLRTKEKGGQI